MVMMCAWWPSRSSSAVVSFSSEQHQTTSRRLTAGGGSISNRQMAHFPSGARTGVCTSPMDAHRCDQNAWLAMFLGYGQPTRPKLFKSCPGLRQRPYWRNRLWSGGYCVSTVGMDEEKIRGYVRYQQNKERRDEAEGREFGPTPPRSSRY